MMEDQYFALIGKTAGILSFVAYILYYISIIRGRSKPNRTTWAVLTLVGLLIAASYAASGASATLWVALAYVVGPFIAVLLSIKYGVGGTTKLDIICLVGALISVILWFILQDPLYVLLINIGIDFIGMVPTLVKSYFEPFSEDLLAWWTTLLANALNVFAIEYWVFSLWVYPVYMVLVNGMVAGFLLRRFFVKKTYA